VNYKLVNSPPPPTNNTSNITVQWITLLFIQETLGSIQCLETCYPDERLFAIVFPIKGQVTTSIIP